MKLIKIIFWILVYKHVINIKNKINIFKQFVEYRKLARLNNFILPKFKDRFLITNENTVSTSFDPHYLYHTSWAARELRIIKPEEHIDISSSLMFISIISAFIKIKFYDYRPPHIDLDNLSCEHGDLCNLPFLNNSINSISCLHVIEHIGLGRYGDPIDPLGDIKSFNELKRVVSLNGHLLIAVPVGKSKIAFNAHRIYSYNYIMNLFDENWELENYTLIPDNADKLGIYRNSAEEITDKQEYGCGCFHFKKISV